MLADEHIYTYREFLENRPEIEYLYELIAGKIVKMPPESPENMRIALVLMMAIASEVGIDRVSNKAEIIISGAKVNSRIPDVTVFSEAGMQEMEQKNTSTIDLDMLPPLLVIEIVSPGKISRDRDYRYKRSEYAARGIAHYWIVDPEYKTMTCLELVDGLYEEEVFKGESVSIIEPINLEVDFRKLFA